MATELGSLAHRSIRPRPASCSGSQRFAVAPRWRPVRRSAVKANGKKRQFSKETNQGQVPNKHALLDLEQNDESVISTLSIYVWDLFEGRSASEIH
jgi:hypothetical protein